MDSFQIDMTFSSTNNIVWGERGVEVSVYVVKPVEYNAIRLDVTCILTPSTRCLLCIILCIKLNVILFSLWILGGTNGSLESSGMYSRGCLQVLDSIRLI